MILAVESSCDESAVAVFDPSEGTMRQWIHSQIELHRAYGGVVPDLASREHLLRFEALLRKAGEVVEWTAVERIAVTRGPGLIGSLAVGMSVAYSLGWSLNRPVHALNHLRGHLFSPFHGPGTASGRGDQLLSRDWFPHLGLIVSGGNTLLCRLERDGTTRIVARTVDDAAGEALDKGAKLLGFPYPGGPEIERSGRGGDPAVFNFPRSCPAPGDLRFSFSGLKTSLRYRLEKMDDATLERQLPDLCASYEAAVVDQLLRKVNQVLEGGDYQSTGLSGGVANNRALARGFLRLGERMGIPAWVAPRDWTGDNAAMMAFLAAVDPASPPGDGVAEADPSLQVTIP